MKRNHNYQLTHGFPFYKNPRHSYNLNMPPQALRDVQNEHKMHQGELWVAPTKWPTLPSFLSCKEKTTQPSPILCLLSAPFTSKDKKTKQTPCFLCSHQNLPLFVTRELTFASLSSLFQLLKSQTKDYFSLHSLVLLLPTPWNIFFWALYRRMFGWVRLKACKWE